jgi:hypothetical protein
MQYIYITFTSTYPDDAVWSVEGDLEVPAGREVAVHIASSLTASGVKCSAVSQRDYYGWEFDTHFAGTYARAVLQLLAEWLLIVEINTLSTPALKVSPVSDSYILPIVSLINLVLKADQRVSSMRIMDQTRYDEYVRCNWTRGKMAGT